MHRRLALLLIVLAGAVLVLQGCGSEVALTTTSPPPPVSASPQVVVERWIVAVNAGDEAAGRVLSTPRFADADHAALDGWFANTLSITGLKTAPPTPISGLQSNKDYRQVTYVPVAFVLDQKHESSFQNGPVQWGFVLVRNGSGERWRINEQGVG